MIQNITSEMEELKKDVKDHKECFFKSWLTHTALVRLKLIRVLDFVKEHCPDVNTQDLLEEMMVHDHDKIHISDILLPYISLACKIKKEKYKNEIFQATRWHIMKFLHHPEAWDPSKETKQLLNIMDRDGVPSEPIDATAMPKQYIIEMMCDWAAVAEQKGTSLKEWVDKMVGTRWKFNEEQVKLIYQLTNILEGTKDLA